MKRNKYMPPEKAIILYWNDKGVPLKRHHIRKTKLFERTQEWIQKEIFKNKRNLNYLRHAIDNYYDLLVSSYTIVHPRKPGCLVDIATFFAGFKSYEIRWLKDRGVDLDIQSWYQECVPGKEPLIKFSMRNTKRKIKDIYFNITHEFKKQYVDVILAGREPDCWTVKEENDFRMASRRLVSFYERYKHDIKFTPLERKYPQNMVHYVYDVLETRFSGSYNGVTTSWIAHEKMYNNSLLIYFGSQAI